MRTLAAALFLLLSFLLAGNCSAYDITLKLGQDTIITQMNYNKTVYENMFEDVSQPLLKLALSHGNSAAAFLIALPGTAGIVRSYVGLQFIEWDTGGYSWDDVKDLKATITITFFYRLGSVLFPDTGSSVAEITTGLDENPKNISVTNEFVINSSQFRYDVSLEDVGNALRDLHLTVYAHSGFFLPNFAVARLDILSITISVPSPE